MARNIKVTITKEISLDAESIEELHTGSQADFDNAIAQLGKLTKQNQIFEDKYEVLRMVVEQIAESDGDTDATFEVY